MKILVTGGAGFIGAALGHRLLDRGDSVVALDNLNSYYEVSLKQDRLAALEQKANFCLIKADIFDRCVMEKVFQKNQFDAVVNLAAQAGVRYSLENPAAYIDSNLVGFGNVLEGCRNSKVPHLVFASSSSVYGGNKKVPFSEDDSVDHPISLYAATKKANELMAHSYAHLYQIPCTALRFFTVYGPWGRPDMAFFKFAKLILAGEPIPIYNNGELTRDFTYIDDIVEGVIRVLDRPASADKHTSATRPSPAISIAPYRVYNIGNGTQINLMDYIKALENALGMKAQYQMMSMQPGDVETTNADMSKLRQQFDFQPNTDIDTGLQKFADWFLTYYRV